jgi:predicted DNA-binding ribbon-helix-helix protein
MKREMSGPSRFHPGSRPLRYAARGNIVKTSIIKRSVVLNGHKTSVSLENEFWDGLCEIARHERLTPSALVERIAHGRKRKNLSSAIRVFVVDHFRQNTFSNKPGPVTPAASRSLFTGG